MYLGSIVLNIIVFYKRINVNISNQCVKCFTSPGVNFYKNKLILFDK